MTAAKPDRRPHRTLARFDHRSLAFGLLSGALLAGSAPAALAQDRQGAEPRFELVPPEGFEAPNSGISLRAQVDVMFQPEDGGPMVLLQDAFETGASGENMSSAYIFEVLNRAAVAGLDQALAKGALAGRVNVVAVCYQFGLTDEGPHSLSQLGVFINTTDMNVLPDGKAAFHTNVKYVPPPTADASLSPFPR